MGSPFGCLSNDYDIVIDNDGNVAAFGEYWAGAGRAHEDLVMLTLGTGVGAGVRWVSPVGVVRLDGAFGVSQPGPPFRVHFSMGPDIAP